MKSSAITSCSTQKLWAILLGNKYPLSNEQIYLLYHSHNVAHISEISLYPTNIVNKIAACLEIGRRLNRQFQQPATLHSPIAIYQYTRDMIQAPQEIVRALFLNSQLQVIGDEVIAIGTLNSAQINIRDLLRPAILYNAHTFVIVHNHPSGDPTASPDDCQLTKYVASISSMINIPLQDHVIIATNGYVSLRSQSPALFEFATNA